MADGDRQSPSAIAPSNARYSTAPSSFRLILRWGAERALLPATSGPSRNQNPASHPRRKPAPYCFTRSASMSPSAGCGHTRERVAGGIIKTLHHQTITPDYFGAVTWWQCCALLPFHLPTRQGRATPINSCVMSLQPSYLLTP